MAQVIEISGETDITSQSGDGDSDFPVSLTRKAVSERLKHAVVEAGGATAVAERARLPLPTLNNYLYGKHEMKLSAAVALAGACHVSLDWLATGIDPGASIMQVGHVENSENFSGNGDVTAEDNPATVRVSQVNDQAPALREGQQGMRAPTKLESDLLAQAIRIVCAVLGKGVTQDPPDQVAERIIKTYEILVGVES